MSPPWEVVMRVATYLDPKTLAIASCVSKLWFSSFSSDFIWKPILATHFPSLSTLPSDHHHPVPSRRLFSLAHAAANRRRRIPSKPTLSLTDLLFTLSISTRARNILSVATPCVSLSADAPGVFRFVVGCDGDGDGDGNGTVVRERMEEVSVAWNVALRGWRGIFTMMEREGKVEDGWWFSQELPSAGCCCSGAVGSAVVADMKVRLCEDGVRVKEVSVGILSVMDWRYVSVEAGLRYLQHFLTHNNATSQN